MTRALLAECVAHPADDAPRLVWADAVGGPRGELIVLQCDAERVAHIRGNLAARHRRERELLAAHAETWSGLAGIATRCRFRRGFVDAIEVPADALLSRLAEIAAAAPLLVSLTITHLGLPTRERLALIVEAAAALRIQALDLLDAALGGDRYWHGDAVREASAIPWLRALGLSPGFGTGAAEALRRSAYATQLEALALRDHRLHEYAFASMVEAMPRLRSLDVRGLVVPLSVPASVTALAIPAAQLAALGASPAAATVERLVLDGTAQPSQSLAVLAQLPGLRALDVSELALSTDDARVIARLRGLRELRCGWTHSTADLRALVAALGPSLDVLDLRRAARLPAHVLADLDCDVLVEEPEDPELLLTGRTPAVTWRSAPASHAWGAQAWLVSETGSEPGRVWLTAREHIRLGRGTICDIVLPDDTIARTHATLDRTGDGYVVHDLGSTNGTLLDGTRVDRAPLADGAQLQLGRTLLRVYFGDGAGARATACARELGVTDPLTGLSRVAPPGAARFQLADRDPIAIRHGFIHLQTCFGLLARRLADAAGARATIFVPAPYELAIAPAARAAELVAAVTATPIRLDGHDIPVALVPCVLDL